MWRRRIRRTRGATVLLVPRCCRILAERLRAGVDITYRCFPDADHGYTHNAPVDTAREAITGLGDRLARSYAAASPERPV